MTTAAAAVEKRMSPTLAADAAATNPRNLQFDVLSELGIKRTALRSSYRSSSTRSAAPTSGCKSSLK